MRESIVGCTYGGRIEWGVCIHEYRGASGLGVWDIEQGVYI